ncbi:MAG: hypothetical protein M1152_05570 [Actinobacteria bacterium]|nr:hypothetical protein [Actinomycetota bacterium]
MIAVGGSAMALHNLRVQSEDIFSSEDIMAEIAKNIEEQSGVSIDVTSKYNLWGILQIPDI